MAAPAQRRQLVLRLYKEILRHARVYPSIRRKEMIEDIRIGTEAGRGQWWVRDGR
jgi:Complex 1 protein (LYR family)